MRPTDDIRDVFKQAKIPADSEQTERILGDALQELQKRSPAQGMPKRPSRWRIIMNSKTTKLSAAAVLLLALGLFLSNINQPKAYGMDEVPALYKLAKTLHLKGTRYFAENNSDKSTVVEHWVDRENGRWRSRSPNYAVNNGKVTVYPFENVYDGNGIAMAIDHGPKQVTYFQMGQLDQTLMEYRYLSQLFNDAFGDPSFYDAYEVVDKEVIDGIEYEIWETLASLHSGPATKTRAWLESRTGHVLKTKT